VGAILVAVNPFERLPIYGEDTIRQAQDLTHSFPHVYVSAAVAYAQVQASGKNQSVLISGESGAGKVSVCESVCVCVCESVCVSVCV
jgi:myosin-5